MTATRDQVLLLHRMEDTGHPLQSALRVAPQCARVALGPWGTCLMRTVSSLAACPQSRLRRQDAGLKTHLDQLDQQISELQLDMSRSSCEAPDSDSRPSSGFYELSDAGSCSLSTSCASVCSDRLSPSLGSWLPVFQPPKSRPGMGDWRPHSADETTVPAWSPQPREEGSKPLPSADDVGQLRSMFRPRPVSTGDLERVLPAELGLQGAGAGSIFTSFLCQGTEGPAHMVDPKYQRDLVARGGQEVYPYPSPLHAVALQSPLFALTKDTSQFDSYSPSREPPLSPGGLSGTRSRPIPELGPAEAYIDRLLRLRRRGDPSRGIVGEQGTLGHDTSSFPQKPCSQRSDSGILLKKLIPRRGGGGMVQSSDVSENTLKQQGPASPVDPQPPSSSSNEGATLRKPAVRGDTAMGPSSCLQTHSDYGQGQALSPSRLLGPESPPLAPGPFVHPLGNTGEAPSSTSPKTGPPQSKATKIRRRASDKVPRLGKQLPPRPERQGGTQVASQLPREWDPSPRPLGGGLSRRPPLAREAPGRSCSESTLYPVPFFVPLMVARQEGYRASSQALFPVEAAPLSSVARRKQRKWQSTVEISAKPRLTSGPGPSLGPPRPPARKASGPWARGRPTLARQDAYAKSESEPSDHSAECSSLFHSTIAETSEGEASDHTANRFGDQESSDSDSEDSVQTGGGRDGAEAGQREQAWPQVAPRHPLRTPGSTRPTLPPVPKLCRIKASKALKKKIRRFQPAALKVMTMV
uniref:dapper homolog 2 isoform X2 n=1 Tax=Jaculus jaculus TaxID=51337 RepID=UPI001E1B1E5B|nr:dapper homolog 2 isoform X2 [Jaculus jaculus]